MDKDQAGSFLKRLLPSWLVDIVIFLAHKWWAWVITFESIGTVIAAWDDVPLSFKLMVWTVMGVSALVLWAQFFRGGSSAGREQQANRV